MTSQIGKPEFIPNGDNREETAVLLVGTAQEFGLGDAVFAVPDGFYVTTELADLIYDDELDADPDLDPEPEPEPEPDPDPAPVESDSKPSGKKAAK